MKSAEVFRSLFALPNITIALQNDTPISEKLRNLAEKRIEVISAHTIAPEFSWCMPDTPNTTSYARVGPFLAEPEQRVQLVGGFNGISHARKWTEKLFGSHGICSTHITAEASGKGVTKFA